MEMTESSVLPPPDSASQEKGEIRHGRYLSVLVNTRKLHNNMEYRSSRNLSGLLFHKKEAKVWFRGETGTPHPSHTGAGIISRKLTPLTGIRVCL